MKPLQVRAAAHHDVEAAASYYRQGAGERVALSFVEALNAAYRLVADHPQSGSSRYAEQLDLADVRVRPLKAYPYLVFYREYPAHIEIWRVLHAQRDIPSWLSGS